MRTVSGCGRRRVVLYLLAVLLLLACPAWAVNKVTITGNLADLYGNAAFNTRVLFSTLNVGTQGAANLCGNQIVTTGDQSVYTDASGNLPTVTLVQGATYDVTIGSGLPIRMQTQCVSSEDLTTLIIANTDPPSLVSSILIGPGGDYNMSVVNPALGSVGAATLTPGLVKGIQGIPVCTTAPTQTGQQLQYNSATGMLCYTGLPPTIVFAPPAPTIITNLSCTNGSATCSMPDTSQATFVAGDVGKLLIAQGQAPDWKATNAYTYNNVIQPLGAQNPGNHVYLNIESGTSGNAAPIPSAWAASTGFVAFQAIKPALANNAGGFIYTAQSAGCISGTVTPATFNQGGVGTTTVEAATVAGGTICTWTNQGTSTWPQKAGARFNEPGTTVWWADTGPLNPATQVFNGCIQAVTNGTTIQLGTISGGVCVPANFAAATQSAMYAYYQGDSLAALNTAAAVCNASQAAPYAGACKIQLAGPLITSNTFNDYATSMEIGGLGMNGNIRGPSATNPVTGSAWFSGVPAGSPIINIQGSGSYIHDINFIGSDLATSQPSTYIQLGQCGIGYGVTSFNRIENIADNSQQAGGNGIPMGGAWVGDDIMERTGGSCTQNDRTMFRNVRVGRPGRSCFAMLQQQSVNNTIEDSSCFQAPIDFYNPNGGEWYINHLEEVAVGESYWTGRSGKLTVDDPNAQPGNSDPIPKGLAYFQDNAGSGGGQIDIRGGTILTSLGITTVDVNMTTSPALIDAHTVHAGTLVDTDTDAQTELYIGPRTRIQEAGLPYRGTTPWIIRGPDIATNSSRILIAKDVFGLQTTNISMNPSHPRSYRRIQVCEGPGAGNNNDPTNCSTNILFGTDTYALMRNDIEPATNFLGGGSTQPQLSVSQILSATCPAAGGTVGTPPGDLYYKVSAIKTDLTGTTYETPTSVSFKSVFDGSHGCVAPSATNPLPIAWLCIPGATQYGIYKCQTTNNGDPECLETAYDTVDAFAPNASGDVPASPCIYTDVGTAVNAAPSGPQMINQTGHASVGGRLNIGLPPAIAGDALGQGNSLGKTTAALLPTYKKIVLTATPGTYFPMGEASGALQDASGNGNNSGAPAGAPTFGQTGPIIDDPTTAIAFGTATDKFSVANFATNPSGDILSYELWFKAAALNRTSILIQQGANGAFLELVPTGQIAFGKNGSGTIMACGSIVDTTTFHYIVVTKNGAALHCYIDNVEGTSIVANATLAPADASFTVGAAATDADGTIGQLAVYKTVLTPAQIAAHFKAGPLIKYGAHYYDSTNNCSTDLVLGNWTNYHCGNRTVGAGANILPTCAAALQGACANVTDDNAACTFGTTATAGGATYCPVGCDGTNWKAGYCGG